MPAKVALSCIFLIGWPFRMSYKGRVGKHNIEVKKAVFVEYSSQDEGVSLSATPGSNANNNHNNVEQQNNNNNNNSAKQNDEVHCNGSNEKSREDSTEDDDDIDADNDVKNVAKRDVVNCDGTSSRLDEIPTSNR